MATPVHTGRQGVPAPGSEPTAAQNSDNPQTITVHVTLRGSAANVLADWNTIIGTNFASPSAVASWDRV